MGRYFARSASDKTDDWPFWYVADDERAGANVTKQLLEERDGDQPPRRRKDVPKGGLSLMIHLAMSMQPFVSDIEAVRLAKWANERLAADLAAGSGRIE